MFGLVSAHAIGNTSTVNVGVYGIDVRYDGVNNINAAGVCSNGSSFVASIFSPGPANFCGYSYDGIIWSYPTLPVTAFWTKVAYGAGLYVMIAQDSSSGGVTNQYVTSPDGLTWTARTLPSSRHWSNISFNGTIFLLSSQASGPTTTYYTSTDGINWTFASTQSWTTNSLTNNGNYFVDIRSNRTSRTTDGITWVTSTIPLNNWGHITHNGTFFIAVAQNAGGETRNCITSTDGVTWTTHVNNPDIYGPITSNGSTVFVFPANRTTPVNYAYKTNDGVNWTSFVLPNASSYFSCTGRGYSHDATANPIIALPINATTTALAGVAVYV